MFCDAAGRQGGRVFAVVPAQIARHVFLSQSEVSLSLLVPVKPGQVTHPTVTPTLGAAPCVMRNWRK
jgi:hypothetical protein